MSKVREYELRFVDKFGRPLDKIVAKGVADIFEAVREGARWNYKLVGLSTLETLEELLNRLEGK